VKVAVDDDDISVWNIFCATTPYRVVMLSGALLLGMFP
jgi:hypothetical protein